ncbi:MAG: hypothetical protein RI897_4129 [Verrucomicrobiota bacterium]
MFFQDAPGHFGEVSREDDAYEDACAVEDPIPRSWEAGGGVQAGEAAEGAADPRVENCTGEVSEGGCADVVEEWDVTDPESVVEDGAG